MSQQFVVTFHDAAGQPIHSMQVECGYAHNAPKVAVQQATPEQERLIRQAAGVKVTAVQQGLQV